MSGYYGRQQCAWVWLQKLAIFLQPRLQPTTRCFDIYCWLLNVYVCVGACISLLLLLFLDNEMHNNEAKNSLLFNNTIETGIFILSYHCKRQQPTRLLLKVTVLLSYCRIFSIRTSPIIEMVVAIMSFKFELFHKRKLLCWQRKQVTELILFR